MRGGTITSVIEITSDNKHETEIFTSLSEPVLYHYYEPDYGLFIAESPKVIERALNAGYEPVSLMMSRKDINGEAKDIVSRCGDIPLYTGTDEDITAATGFRLIRGALCAMRRRKMPKCCRFEHGCSTADKRLHRPALQAFIKSQHGNGISGAVDVYQLRHQGISEFSA